MIDGGYVDCGAVEAMEVVWPSSVGLRGQALNRPHLHWLETVVENVVTARDGQTLTASSGSWAGTEPITYASQWQRCNSSGEGCSNISGATSLSYSLGPGNGQVGTHPTLCVDLRQRHVVGSISMPSSFPRSPKPVRRAQPRIAPRVGRCPTKAPAHRMDPSDRLTRQAEQRAADGTISQLLERRDARR